MNNSAKVNEQFSQWATSFSGCDGGDLSAPIWFCGIEDGIDSSKADAVRKSIDLIEWKNAVCEWTISGPKGISEDKRESFFKDSRYDQNVLKLHAAIFGEFQAEGINGEVGKFKIGGSWVTQKGGKPAYLVYADEHHAYAKFPKHQDRSIFKLNLYPIPFLGTDKKHWSKAHEDATKFHDKEAYQDWCSWKRFEMICKWRKSTPTRKTIICTGTENLSDYLLAFGWDQTVETFTRRLFTLKASLYKPAEKIKCYHLDIDDALIIVIPFLGNHRLNSHKDIVAVGKWIKSLIDQSA
jgi:hypothetical protein